MSRSITALVMSAGRLHVLWIRADEHPVYRKLRVVVEILCTLFVGYCVHWLRNCSHCMRDDAYIGFAQR